MHGCLNDNNVRQKSAFAFIHCYNTVSRAQDSYFGVTHWNCYADIMNVTHWDEFFIPQSEEATTLLNLEKEK
jgi:hypothetical protein